jgi:hypoxanthine phosphoribosyltransferase
MGNGVLIERLTWDEVDIAIENLVYQLKDTRKGLRNVYGIPRGGLIPAVMLSHRLHLPLLNSTAHLDFDRHTLIVDDISDSGKTLISYTGFVTVTIHIAKKTAFMPTYYARIRQAAWVVYPWEMKEEEKVRGYEKS